MRGFKAKALRKLNKLLHGDEPCKYMTEPVGGKPGTTHTKWYMSETGQLTPFQVINPMVRTEKWFRLYKKMKRELR